MYILQKHDGENPLEYQGGIAKEAYADFLSVCFQSVTVFSLSRARWTFSDCADLENELRKWLVNYGETKKWFGYDYTQEPDNGNSVIEVFIYEANRETEKILLQHTDDIFLGKWKDGKYTDSHQTLEDLCFFRNDEML